MTACGSTGWFDDFSKAAAAQFISLSKTLSMTLVKDRVSQEGLGFEFQVNQDGSYRGFLSTKTTTSEKV